MSYQEIHRVLLILFCCVVIAAAVGALFYFEIVLQVGVVVVALALLWIGWELHRLVYWVKEFMGGFVEGYQESITRGN